MSEQQSQGADQALDLNNEMQSRREKLAALRKEGIAFPNDFRRDATSDKLHSLYDEKDKAELEDLNIEVSVAGRMMTRRIMGKAAFVTLQDMGGRIQLYVARDDLPEGLYNDQFKNGTWVTSLVRAVKYSALRRVNCLSIVPKFVC